MSRSNPLQTNPSTRRFTWKGGAGKLIYWDKVSEKEVEVKLPFEFLPIDQLSTITGYLKSEKSSFWSNEVRNSTKEEFTVRTKGGIKYTGLYKSDQGVVQVPKGASFAKSIYLAYWDESIGEFVIGNFQASGSALGAWIEFSNACKPENGKVIVRKGAEQEAPTGPFYPPTFEYVSATSEENEAAVKLDEELQIYLNRYLSAVQLVNQDEMPQEGSDEDLSSVFPE